MNDTQDSPNRVHIDPAKVPAYVWEQSCKVLNASITRALANPELRREYEAWKAEQAAARAAMQGEVNL